LDLAIKVENLTEDAVRIKIRVFSVPPRHLHPHSRTSKVQTTCRISIVVVETIREETDIARIAVEGLIPTMEI